MGGKGSAITVGLPVARGWSGMLFGAGLASRGGGAPSHRLADPSPEAIANTSCSSSDEVQQTGGSNFLSLGARTDMRRSRFSEDAVIGILKERASVESWHRDAAPRRERPLQEGST